MFEALASQTIELHLKYRESLYSDHFKKPHFHIVVLFVDEK